MTLVAVKELKLMSYALLTHSISNITEMRLLLRTQGSEHRESNNSHQQADRNEDKLFSKQLSTEKSKEWQVIITLSLPPKVSSSERERQAEEVSIRTGVTENGKAGDGHTEACPVQCWRSKLKPWATEAITNTSKDGTQFAKQGKPVHCVHVLMLTENRQQAVRRQGKDGSGAVRCCTRL